MAMQSSVLKAVGGHVQGGARPIVALSVSRIHESFARFLKDPFATDHVGAMDAGALRRVLDIDADAAQALLPVLTGAVGPFAKRRAPVAWADGFLAFALAIVCAAANPATKVRLLHQLFDLDSNGALTADEVVVLLRCVLHGVAFATGGRPTPTAELEGLARDSFAAADVVADGRLSLSEFSGWVRESPEARAILRLFPSSGAPLLPWAKPPPPSAAPAPRVAPAGETTMAAVPAAPGVRPPHLTVPDVRGGVGAEAPSGVEPATPTGSVSSAAPPSPTTRRRRMDELLQRIETVAADTPDRSSTTAVAAATAAPRNTRRPSGTGRGSARGGRGGRGGGGRGGGRGGRDGAASAPAARRAPVVLRYSESRRAMAAAYMSSPARHVSSGGGGSGGGGGEDGGRRAAADLDKSLAEAGALSTVESGSEGESDTGESSDGREDGGGGGTGGGGASGDGRGKRSGTRRVFQGRYRRAQVAEVVKRFRHMDEDGSGTVSVLEFAREMGSTLSTTTQLFSAVDKDGSGEISLVELLQLHFSGATRREWDQILRWAGLRGTRARREAEPAQRELTAAETAEIREVFDAVDADRDGLVSFPQVVDMLTSEGGIERAEAMQMCIDADMDENGQLDFDEFREKLMDHFRTDTMSSIMATYKRDSTALPPPQPAMSRSKSQRRRALGVHSSYKAT